MNSKIEYTLGADIAKLVRSWRSIIDLRLKPIGLTQTHWITLYYLNTLPPNQSQIQLAKAIGIEPPSLVRTLDQLEHRGLVRRDPCPCDRRAKQINLTDEAKPVLIEVNDVVESVKESVLAGVSEDQLETFINVIKAFEQNIAAMVSK